MTGPDELPVAVPPFGPPVREATVAGVLLAAGRSERFGPDNKLLAPLDGEPLVVHAARTLLAARLDRVVVVVGHDADRVRAALADLDMRTVENPNYATGQATSVRTGLAAVGDADAVVVALGDAPAVSPRTVDLLVRAYLADAGDVLAAAYRGQRGNPVLFDAGRFDGLAAGGDPDTGGRALVLSSGTLVETGDPGVLRDVDTPEDLAALEREQEREHECEHDLGGEC